MNISIVIAASTEEKYLRETLGALTTALESVDDAEIILVDNESTDVTREIALSNGSRILGESEHDIGKVRNTGAEAANAD